MLHVSTALKRAFDWRIPSYLYIVTVLAMLFIIVNKKLDAGKVADTLVIKQQFNSGLSSVKFLRSDHHQLAKPLLMTETTETPESMISLKDKIEKEINNNVQQGNITNASVFLRKINESGAVVVNNEEIYNPGSMMKIPVMITCLKEGMKDISLLEKKILFEKHNSALLHEEGSTAVLTEGKYYTVRELIEYMIIDSDNDAMGLLYSLLGQEKLNNIFSELGIPLPPSNAPSFDLNPVQFSRFLMVLYNSTYLDTKNSEWALSTLIKAKYKKSLTRNLPANIQIAHKYGVASSGPTRILNESAIVYHEQDPYLIVVMTKGHDYSRQSDVISRLSDLVYKSISKEL